MANVTFKKGLILILFSLIYSSSTFSQSKVKLKNFSDDFSIYIKELDEFIDKTNKEINRRQDAEKCYMITTYAYITSIDYIKNCSDLFTGKVGGFEIAKNESIDIDDEQDFDIASYIYNKNYEHKN